MLNCDWIWTNKNRNGAMAGTDYSAFTWWGSSSLATRPMVVAGPLTSKLPTCVRAMRPVDEKITEQLLGADQRRRARLLATSAAQAPDGNDIWRDSLLRYAGYANEIGESFRNVAPKMVVPSYAVSIAYVLGDTADKAYGDYSAGKSPTAVAKVGVDVLVWQMLASVGIPGLTINLVVKGVSSVVRQDALKRLPKSVQRWAPTAVGLGVIPFIVAPIDEGVTWAMDETVRKWFKTVGETP